MAALGTAGAFLVVCPTTVISTGSRFFSHCRCRGIMGCPGFFNPSVLSEKSGAPSCPCPCPCPCPIFLRIDPS